MKKIVRKSNQIPAALKSIDVKAVLRKRGMFLKLKQNQDLKEEAKSLARQLLKKSKAGAKAISKEKEEPRRHAQFTNEQVLDYWQKQIHIVEILEKRFDNKVQQFIQKVVDGFLAHLESEIATNKKFKAKNIKVKGYFDDNEDDLLVSAQLDFTPLLVDQAILAGQEAYKLIGVDDIYTPFKLREVIAENVDKFTHSMLDTDRKSLENIISNGLQDGLSVPEIRGSIQTSFENIQKSQAERITRTEVLRASTQATLDAYKQSGVVEGKQWLTAGADDECANYEGQIESLSGDFYSDTNEFQDGDPPLHPNCRCVILPVLLNES